MEAESAVHKTARLSFTHRTGETVVRMLRDLCSTLGVTVVASTHDPTVADEASRVVRMKDGQIVTWALPNSSGEP